MGDFNKDIDAGRDNNLLYPVECGETRTQISFSSKNSKNHIVTTTSLEYTRFTKSENNLNSPSCDEDLSKLLKLMSTQHQEATPSQNNRLSIEIGPTDQDLNPSDLNSHPSSQDIRTMKNKYFNVLKTFVHNIGTMNSQEKIINLNYVFNVMQHAWAISTHVHKLGYSLCTYLRLSGGLEMLIENCMDMDENVQFSSAQLLEQCLIGVNITHVVENGLEKVVKVAVAYAKSTDTKHSRVGTGILEHLFKHSERTCDDVIRLGGLDAILFECRRNDLETLRNCARSLANLSLYGGHDNQEAMISEKVPLWLFPLAFNDDDNIKYYACLAIAVLAANKEIEAEVLKWETLDLVEPFITSQDPSKFARSNLANVDGQCKEWLQRLVPVLSSNRQEAIYLAAFHFCMEAGIKKEQRNTKIFREIGAIEPLKTVATCPNGIASKFAAQTLRLIGETVPHKLSRQVPLWSVEDVQEWVKQLGFGSFECQFVESQVDGDMLLKLNDQNLKEDIGISNGILRKRFARELQNLKKMADYSSKDCAEIYAFLNKIGPDYCVYTYDMLNAGISTFPLKRLIDSMLLTECGIKNSIHRNTILDAAASLNNNLANELETDVDKPLDVFVSYRRSSGSQLASLLKVHLQLRRFSVFLDVERLESGKFDSGLLNSIRQAKHFILVLTSNALDRCLDDYDGKDWVHREIVTALSSNCNIIPIIENFSWPEYEKLPEDIRSIRFFNGVKWIHDYQDACINKLERFLRGESKTNLVTLKKKSISEDFSNVHFGGHSMEDRDLFGSSDELRRSHSLNNINNGMSRDSSEPIPPHKLSNDNLHLLVPSSCFGRQTLDGSQNKSSSVDEIIESCDENDDFKLKFKSRNLNQLSDDFPIPVPNIVSGDRNISNHAAPEDVAPKNESFTKLSSDSQSSSAESKKSKHNIVSKNIVNLLNIQKSVYKNVVSLIRKSK